MAKIRRKGNSETRSNKPLDILKVVALLAVVGILAYAYKNHSDEKPNGTSTPKKKEGSSMRKYYLEEPLTFTIGYRIVDLEKADARVKPLLENLQANIVEAEGVNSHTELDEYFDPYAALNELSEYSEFIKGHIAPPVGTTGIIGEKPASGIGETGGPTNLPSDLSQTAQSWYDEGWSKNYFNQFVSDMISWTRSIPDGRPLACKKKTRYLPLKDLPKTGIIICFINEAWSTLMRTVNNVLTRTPDQLLTEIVLVDDNSDLEHLQYPLEALLSHPFYKKVKLIRCGKREGLIRARMIGLKEITAPVVTFLDSHIELGNDWLIPLLDLIARDPTTVVNPMIDPIDMNTLQYHWVDDKSQQTGIFDWQLQFNWRFIPPRISRNRRDTTEPFVSPAMAGGIFSINVEFFKKLGFYDPGFDYWGGDNLELSFKAWMCGGSIKMIPCSHVGHIFRDGNPYKFENYSSNFEALNHNMARVADVWLDEYKQLYFDTLDAVPEFGDVEERKQLRKDLKCRSFQWYLDTVFPELFIPTRDKRSDGHISNMENLCWSTEVYKPFDMQPVILQPCSKDVLEQNFMLSVNHAIHKRDLWCIDYEVTINTLVVFRCDNKGTNQKWIYNPKHKSIKHGIVKKCVIGDPEKMKPYLGACNHNDPSQQWTLENYVAFGGNSKPEL